MSLKLKRFAYALKFCLLAGLLCGLIATLRPAVASFGKPSQVHRAASGTPALSTLLNPDGTLDLSRGFRGSLNPQGFRLEYAANGAPRFVPAAPAVPTAGEVWDAQFVNANGAQRFGYAVAVIGTDVYLGGAPLITAGGTGVSGIAKWNGSSWSVLGNNSLQGQVYAMAVSGSDLYVGGFFTVTTGTGVTRGIAKWDGNAWVALGTGLPAGTAYVLGLAFSGSDLYIGGKFPSAGGVTASNIAKWNGSAWSALGSGTDQQVVAVAVSGSDVYAGGEFSTAGGNPASFIARWNGSVWSALGSGMNGFVQSLAVSGSDLYAGGTFSTAGGVSATGIAKWNGSVWAALGSGLLDANTQPANVRSILIVGSNLYAAGTLATAGGNPANGIAKWNGSVWAALGGGLLNGAISTSEIALSIAASGSDLYVAGPFTKAGGMEANRIAKWNGSAWSPLGNTSNSVNNPVYAIAVSGNDVYVGGEFDFAGGVAANHIARWNGSSWAALGSGVNSRVNALAVSGNDVYAGGFFTQAGGNPANRVARWNGSAWSALGSGVDGQINALAISGTSVYAGGFFFTAGGNPASNIAKWNGSAWSALGSGINSFLDPVLALAVSGSDLYVGGNFADAGGVASTTNIAKWNGSTWSAVGGGTNNTVRALAVSGSDVYAGGDFTMAGGNSASRVAKWNGSVWSALGSGLSQGSAVALAATGSDLYAGGNFVFAGGMQSLFIAKWDGSSWQAIGGANGTDNLVLALGLQGTNLFAGGEFTQIGGVRSHYFGRFGNTPPTISSVILMRTAGAGSSNSTIATVSDTETAAGSLTVTVTSANPLNGVTVSNLVNTNGTITADIVASCTATDASFTLQVSDGAATATTTLNVTVAANTAPTLNYNNASVTFGSATTVNAATGPTDNSSVSSIAVQSVTPSSAPGTITVNNTTGVVTVPNNVPVGSYTVTIRATDNCGATTDAQFTLNVTCPATVVTNGDDSGAGSLRQIIADACAGGTLTFQAGVTTVTLTSAELLVNKNLTIDGGAGVTVTRSTAGGTPNFRIFRVQSATVAMNNLTVSNGNNLGQAGGIQNSGTLTLTACTISGNTAPQGGGIQSDNILTMTDCTVSNNIASDFGGGLKIFGPTTTLTNCTFSNNQSAHDSSAIESHTGVTLTLTNCTIANNQAGTGAGQTGSALFANSGTVLKNTIVTNNSGNNANIAGTVDTANSFNNLIGSVGRGGLTNGVNGNLAGVANANTLLAALSNYGGTTPTIALLPGSPAINAGTTTGAPVTDQRGIARVGSTDIGAFEARGFTLALNGGDNQSAVTSSAFANPLAVLVSSAFSEPVNGGRVLFTPPVSGASASLAGNPAPIAGGVATTGTVTANAIIGGPYNVAASANGASTGVSFSLTNINSAPSFTPVAALSRQQGSPAGAAVTIGTVNDLQTAAGLLTVTQLAGGTAMGITVTGITNNNGTISAMVNAACTAVAGTVRFQVSDGDLTGTGELQVNVAANIAPSLTYPAAANVAAGGATMASASTATDNGSITGFSIVSVVPPLTTAPTVNSSGVVSITNASPAGAHVITVQVTDDCGATTNASFTLTVNCQIITVNPTKPALPTARAGTAYSQTFTQTGALGAVTFSVSAGALPAGLTLAAGGQLTGTPTVNGQFNFTVRATDANACFGEQAYTLLVHPACTAITIHPAMLAHGFQSTAYNQMLTATGGGSPYTFAVMAGSLPGGLTLATGGALMGTPTTPGTFNFTVMATDNTGCTGTRAYTVIISGDGLMFYPLPAPVRLLDTRPGASPNACSQPDAPIQGQTARTQLGRSTCTIPANAVALTGNITTVLSGGGFLTLYPSDAIQPTVANTNYTPNEIINNVFTVGLGADGAFKIFAFNTTDVVVDVTGYYAPPVTGGLFFHPLPVPVRLLETRVGFTGCVTPGAPLVGNAESTQQAISPCTGIPAAARAIVGNATTVDPQGNGFLTLFPGDAARPLVASSNYNPGQIVNGPFSVGLAANGEFKIFSFATTELVVDVLGYYSPEAVDVNGAGLLLTPLTHPVRLLETRTGQPVGCFKPGAPLTGQQEYTQAARGVCDGLTIPANALGVVGNATVVAPLGQGFLTLWPRTVMRPLVATSNYNPGDVGNRHFIVGLGQADGTFKMYSFATADLVIDLSGYFAP